MGLLWSTSSEVSFREGNEYFSFRKNIHLIILGFVGRIMYIGHLGESQGYAQVTSPYEVIQKPNQIRAKTTVKTKSGKR